MATLTLIRKSTEPYFFYELDNVLISKTRESWFLSALSAYIDYDGENATQWDFNRSAPTQNTNQTSYLGLDGLYYTAPYPSIFRERIENGTNPMTGGPNYSYTNITDVYTSDPSIMPDTEVYVPDPMGGNQTLANWKVGKLFTGSTDLSSGNVIGFKEVVTGFIIPLAVLDITLGANGEPSLTESTYAILRSIAIIKALFSLRNLKTLSINSLGEIS